MQTEPRHDDVQVIDIAALHALLQGEATQEVATIADAPADTQTRELPAIPSPGLLTPADTWDLPREAEPVYPPLHGNLWGRWQQWLRRDGNAMGAAILIGFVGILVVVTLAGVAFAAKELPSTAGSTWIATENNGTVDFLVGIPTSDGSFSGEWRSLAPGQAQYTIVAMSGYVKGGVVHITERDGTAVNIVGRIEGNGASARIAFGFATFKAADWNDYKNALLNRGH